jgi:hypothetical protein
MHRSPFNSAVQTQDRGGEYWVMQMVFRNLTSAQRATLSAYLANLNGMQHRVSTYNHAENNQGSFGGSPLVAGASQTGKSLNVDGCSNNITNWIRAGDFFSVNGELKICTANGNTDGGGNITIPFAPRLRSAPSDNAVITTSQGTGTFVLANNTVSWSNRPGGFSDVSISLVEDIAA